MTISNPDFYAQYGLINVREAMKRPFNQAFPAAHRFAQQPRTAPQLQSRGSPHLLPWTFQPETNAEQAAKRRRCEPADLLPSAAPLPSLPLSAPLLAIRSQNYSVSAPMPTAERQPMPAPAPGVASENYAIEGVTDADLYQCVQLLGWDADAGMVFLKTIAKVHITLADFREDAPALASKTIAFVDTLTAEVDQGLRLMPPALKRKMLDSAVNFLRKVCCGPMNHRVSVTQKVKRQMLVFLNKNWAALEYIRRHGGLDTADDFRFVSGSSRFSFLVWCADKKIRLTDKELEYLLDLNGFWFTKPMQVVYEQIKRLASQQNNAS
ncbi:MAG: hypothetical protein NBV65_04870 [Burkholderiaceae bacterium]|nr:hypothetical protein [Burkholderiaceae bacterium]